MLLLKDQQLARALRVVLQRIRGMTWLFRWKCYWICHQWYSARARCEFASSTHSGGKGRTRIRVRVRVRELELELELDFGKSHELELARTRTRKTRGEILLFVEGTPLPEAKMTFVILL